MVFEGENVVKIALAMRGETNPLNAVVGKIRGDFVMDVKRTVVHASSSVDEANEEIKLWFKESELVDWKKDSDVWIYE
jgi:nucleoside-diphosphate kinase